MTGRVHREQRSSGTRSFISAAYGSRHFYGAPPARHNEIQDLWIHPPAVAFTSLTKYGIVITENIRIRKISSQMPQIFFLNYFFHRHSQQRHLDTFEREREKENFR